MPGYMVSMVLTVTEPDSESARETFDRIAKEALALGAEKAAVGPVVPARRPRVKP